MHAHISFPWGELLASLLLSAIGPQPASNLQTFNEGKRSVSYTFTASPTSGVTYKATFTPLIAGIPTPQTERFNSAALRTTSGLTPDVTYRLQVFAVKNSVESAAISRDFTTRPDGNITVYFTIWHSILANCLIHIVHRKLLQHLTNISSSHSVPTGPPQGLCVADRTTTSITLTWSDPAPDRINDRDGATGFEVRRDGQRMTTVTDSTYTFTGLRLETSYDFEVLAINEQGIAPDNHAAELTTPTASGGMQLKALVQLSVLYESKPNVYCHDDSRIIACRRLMCVSAIAYSSLCYTPSSPQPPNPASDPPQVLYHLPGVEGSRALCR